MALPTLKDQARILAFRAIFLSSALTVVGSIGILIDSVVVVVREEYEFELLI